MNEFANPPSVLYPAEAYVFNCCYLKKAANSIKKSKETMAESPDRSIASWVKKAIDELFSPTQSQLIGMLIVLALILVLIVTSGL